MELSVTDLVVEEPAGVEVDLKVDGPDALARLDGLAAARVVAVALDVHHAVEVGVGHAHLDGDPGGEAVDLDARLGEVGGRGRRRHDGRAAGLGVALVSVDAGAVADVVDGVAGHAEGVGAARVAHARVQARVVPELAVPF